MTEMKWTSQLSVHVAEIDKQHEYLVDLLNSFYTGMQNSQQAVEQEKVLAELIAYTESHFSTEEKYFTEFEYDMTNGHVQEHRQFEQKLDALREDFLSGELADDGQVLVSLFEWLSNHILHSDARFGQFIKKNSLQRFLRPAT